MRYYFLAFLWISCSFAEPIIPLPQYISVDQKKAKLGKSLFFDPIISRDGTISCSRCHDLFNGGSDNRKFSIGIEGKIGNINSPTVLNAVFNFRQFWDARAKNLKEQVLFPIQNPIEMGNTIENLIKELKHSHYEKMFQEIYHDGVTENNIADAIAEFEKTLITPNSPFDRYLRGDKNAISEKQKEGYSLFKQKGCIACHHGKNVGGNLYNKFGIIIPIKDNNLGRYNVTKKEEDKYFFKVPSLRNVAKTSPYFHNGSIKSLKDAVYLMAKHQLGRPMSDDEAEKIVAFLNSLSGELPKSLTE